MTGKQTVGVVAGLAVAAGGGYILYREATGHPITVPTTTKTASNPNACTEVQVSEGPSPGIRGECTYPNLWQAAPKTLPSSWRGQPITRPNGFVWLNLGALSTGGIGVAYYGNGQLLRVYPQAGADNWAWSGGY